MCHVLIIEDAPLIAVYLQTLLEDAGASSFAFADSEADAVASAMELRPAVITSDVCLRSGTGPSAVRTIQERLGAIPVMFVTANPDQCGSCEPSCLVLSKPIDPAAVLHAFNTLRPY